MNFKNFDWSNNYKVFIDYLFSLKDAKYSEFQGGLVKNIDCPIIGVRTPLLKQIAKDISKNDYQLFIKNNCHQYYEEIILHGLVITYLKKDFETTISLLEQYIPYINSWATCDIIISNFKIIKKNLELGFLKIKGYVKSDNPWMVRVGLVLLLSYYVNDTYIDEILNIANHIQLNDYYVQMANAWLISLCLIKQYNKTYTYLLHDQLDDFTHNKALQKGIESYRIIDKDALRKLKRK